MGAERAPGGRGFGGGVHLAAGSRRRRGGCAGRRRHRGRNPPRGAATDKLAIWVGGDQTIFERYKPVLYAIGDQASYVGPIGAATVAKLVHNCAGYMLNRALSEVFTMGAKAGVEPLTLWAAVRQGALGRMRTFDSLAGHFLPALYDPPDFALRLAHKDVSLAVALGRELNVPMPMANLRYPAPSPALHDIVVRLDTVS